MESEEEIYKLLKRIPFMDMWAIHFNRINWTVISYEEYGWTRKEFLKEIEVVFK